MAAHLDDQQELENFKYFWHSKGRWLFAVLLLASLVYLGWVLYQGHIETKNEEAATALAGLVEKAKTSQDKQSLQADLSILQQNYPESISSAQATMMVAADLFDQGQYEAAEKQLNWVLQNQQIPFVRALAIQRLATVQLQQKKYDAALATLKMPVDAAFEALILETQGDVLYAQGKNKEALAVYEQALAKTVQDAPGLQLLQLKADELR
ncbi:YfgM family protein [Neisseria elongata]|uniref:YfgM family protein n=1 Tax=Neisseria elongata TaxID=495 RepID=UPI00361412D6